MVRKIVNVVEDKCEEGRFPQNFANRIKFENLGFAEARNIVRSEYLNGNVPSVDHVDLFRNMIRLKKSSNLRTNRTNSYVSPPSFVNVSHANRVTDNYHPRSRLV
eukprot:GHVR01185043.1.p1 GENE.GHVR01185043.1~~GHVR01185043.1.p1  ORF type:complete len:105 (+),score=1.42 GHVR01185043.1:449-763(+)